MFKRINSLLALALLSSACTLTIGWPSRLSNELAPTEVALSTTAEPVSSAQVVRPPEPIALPQGFAISVFAEGLQKPRMLAVGPDGLLYVAERGAGRIVRLPDANGDGLADGIDVVAEELEDPTSLAFYQDGSLYVAEMTRVVRFSAPDGNGIFQDKEVVIPDLPSGHHSTRTITFSPDYTALYISIGSSCNLCIEEDERRAAILRYHLDDGRMTLFARGLRNAVGLTFRPGTDQLWVTNNGTDLMGDDLPPETVYIVEGGQDYGWPRCHAGRIADPEFGQSGACDGIPRAVIEITAHSAPLGLAFYTGQAFPEEYRGDLFVALHGSWNRSTPSGYKVVRVPMDGDRPGPAEDFAVGWLRENGQAWGRPVAVITGADGSLFVSDDSSGRIYRIFYTGK